MVTTLTFLVFTATILISHSAVIDHSSENVANNLVVPRGQTRNQYLKSIADYWTPERMASAVPMEPVIRKADLLLTLYKSPKSTKALTVLAPSELLVGMQSNNPSIAGKVYFVMNGKNYLCSGSVVNSDNRDTVITAGHCMFDYDTQTWASNWIFVPQYTVGSRPLGTFIWRKMATKNGWMNNRDFNFDVGVVVMNVNDKGEHVQDVAGGLGITLDAPRQATTTSFGYPKNINNGERVSQCVGVSVSPTFISGFTGLQLACGMTGGSSGGPWIQDYSVTSQTGQQISVNSFIYSTRPNNMFGPYFTENNIGSLYREYQNQ